LEEREFGMDPGLAEEGYDDHSLGYEQIRWEGDCETIRSVNRVGYRGMRDRIRRLVIHLP
jgi:hypothetical protein